MASSHMSAAAALGVSLLHFNSKVETISNLEWHGSLPHPPPQLHADTEKLINANGSRWGMYMVVYQGSQIVDVARFSFLEETEEEEEKEEKESKETDLGKKEEKAMEAKEARTNVEKKDEGKEGKRLEKKEEKVEATALEQEKESTTKATKEEEAKESKEGKKSMGKIKGEKMDGSLRLRLCSWSHATLSLYCRGGWIATRAYQLQWLQNHDKEEWIRSRDVNDLIAETSIFTDWRINLTYNLEFEGPLLCTADHVGLNVSLDHFKFRKALGEGASAMVYECEYSNNQYAVKVIDVTGYFDHQETSEINILSCLQDESVVSFYQAWFEKFERPLFESQYYAQPHYVYVCIHMEVCERTLADFIHQGNEQTTAEEKWVLFENIANAVKYIHQHNIIHRDLKPGNILFGRDGSIKLADFGHSCRTRSGAKGARHLGTMFYMPPELRNTSETTTDKADVYCIGVIYLEIFLPFKNRFNGLYDLMQGHYSSNWPVDIELLEKLTASLPSERPSIYEVLEIISTKKAKAECAEVDNAECSDTSKSKVKHGDRQDGGVKMQESKIASFQKENNDGGERDEAEGSHEFKFHDEATDEPGQL